MCEVRIAIFPRRMRISRFAVKVPVYDEGYELVCAIYDFSRAKNKHFACGATSSQPRICCTVPRN